MLEKTVAVILAGGAGRRMGGGAKPLALVAGRTLVSRVVDAIRPQVDAMALNVNDPSGQYRAYGLARVADSLPDRQGPLAGILAGLDWAGAHHDDARWLLSIPADAPFLPGDLVARLVASARQSGAAYARSGERDHPVVGLWPLTRRDALADLLAAGIRRADAWPKLLNALPVVWPDLPIDPFFNVNTPEDLERARRLCSADG
jgi:molybdopterin-guanine dinucleotide biosynthesis protein A